MPPASLRVWVAPSGGVHVEWTRAAGPPYLLGWHVERQLSDGRFLRVTDVRVEAGMFDPPSAVYRVRDAACPARAGDSVSYRLVTVDPELREWPSALADCRVESEDIQPMLEPFPPPLVNVRTERPPAKSLTGTQVRIVVTNEGLVRLTSSQIAAVLRGYDSGMVEQALAQTNLALSCGGQPVAWRAGGGGRNLLFFGQAYRDIYTERNVYWLTIGRGQTMAVSNRTTPMVVGDAWFWETVREEWNPNYDRYLPGDAQDDYYVWTGWQLSQIPNFPALNTSVQWTTNVSLPDHHPDVPEGIVTAHLISAYNGPVALDNRTRILADGQLLDDRRWAGDQRLAQSGAATNLSGSSVAVTIQLRREEEVNTTRVMVDALEVRYARRMRARNNQLLFTPEPGASTLTVHGFTSSAIQVYEVSDPHRPVRIAATITEQGNSNWRASWTVNSAVPGRFLAAAVYATPERIEGATDSGWGRAKAGAPHVVIASRALASAANALVAHRRLQGLHSLLVPVEDIFDVFSYGRPDPRAIPRFLAYAKSHWTVKPEYVCLAGDGHTDYLDRFHQAQTRPNHVPPMQDRTPYSTSSGSTLETIGLDNPLADTDGDGIPDVAIGRLPAQTPEALARMINRIVVHESSESWKRNVLIVADKDPADSFVLAGRRTEMDVPPWMTTRWLDYGSSASAETVRDGWNSGSLFSLYFGHANNVGIGTPYFFEHSFSQSTLSFLTNAAQTPFLIAGTCMLNNFADPRTNSRCLGKGFLDTALGGPVAVWASASESTLAMAETTAKAILKKLTMDQQTRLGSLIQPALAIQAGSASPWTVRSSVLMGDPGTRVRTHLVLDRTPPLVRIVRPTPSSRHTTALATVNLSGSASDLNGIVRVVVRNDRGRSESAATGTASWRLDRVPLYHGTNRISVVATDRAGNAATATLSVVHQPVSAIRRKVNVGGRAAEGGWEADAGVSSPAGRRDSISSPIARAGAVPQAVYQTWRQGRALAYDFNVPSGKYAVRLHFADSISTLVGQRRFDVEVEGRRLLAHYDIYASAGGRKRATTKTFRNVQVQGGLQIMASATQGMAQLNGIEFWTELPRVIVSSSPVTVPEGERAAFTLRLSDPPRGGAVTVWVERVSGDVDLGVAAGARRVFTAANYATGQRVALAADLDADSRHGSAAIRCSAWGYLNGEMVARERDRDIPEMAVTPALRAVGSAAGRSSFAVANQGRGQMVYAARSSASWIRIGSSGRGTNTGRIVVSFAANPSIHARTGTVSVSAPGTIGSPKRVRIVQSGRPSLHVWPVTRPVGFVAGVATFMVTNRGDGAVRYTAQSSASWLHVDTGAIGTNSGVLAVAYARNLSASARTGTVTVTAAGAVGSPRLVTVVQAANPPVLSIDPESQAFGDVPIGTSADLMFTVENQGGGTLAGGATVPAPFWIVSGGTYQLGPGERQTVTVRYSPQADGVDSANVQFTGAGEFSALVAGNASWTPAVHRKINCGGPAVFAGWSADEGGTGEPVVGADTNGFSIMDVGDVPPSVYQSRRNAQTLAYELAIPDGRYDIRLHFSEPSWSQAGQRVFDVEIEGATVWTNVDLFAVAGGRHRAVARTFEGIEVVDGLQIRGLASAGLAQFNGIEVWSSEPAAKQAEPGRGQRMVRAGPVSWPRVWARSGETDWTVAPELVDGDVQTIWRGAAGSTSWSLALDFEDTVPLMQLEMVYEGLPWTKVEALGAVAVAEWFDLDQVLERPVNCRFVFIQFLDDGSGSAPVLRELDWEKDPP